MYVFRIHSDDILVI